MKQTTADIPYNPREVGCEVDGRSIACRAGTVTVAGADHDVSARDLTAQIYESKLARTEVWLVYDPETSEVRYEKVVGSPDNPTALEENLTPLARLLAVEYEGGERVRGQKVDVRSMTETRHVQLHDDETGERLVDVWKRRGRMPESEARRIRRNQSAGERYRFEPATEQREEPITS